MGKVLAQKPDDSIPRSHMKAVCPSPISYMHSNKIFCHFIEKPDELAREKIADTLANAHPVTPSQTLIPGPCTAACRPTTEESRLHELLCASVTEHWNQSQC